LQAWLPEPNAYKPWAGSSPLLAARRPLPVQQDFW
jgi:hypothetical protein